MNAAPDVRVRPAREDDIPAIVDIFESTYGDAYPYEGYFDPAWLKRSLFNDDMLMLVAEDSRAVLGTASVVFDIGAHSDLTGEFGRLAVHPDSRGRGVGGLLMAERVAAIGDRLHLGLVENRSVHPYSQRISLAHGFAAVGFIPRKNLFAQRESVALFARHFGDALALRRNNPRLVPEAHPLAGLALAHCGLPQDPILDEDAAPYAGDIDLEVEDLSSEGLPALLRIERGRVHRREIFGPMRLHYGSFMLQARKASYMIARRPAASGVTGPLAGAVGYSHDPVERAVRVFELITQTDRAVPFLLRRLLARCRDLGVEYIDADVSAHAPRMQRTLVELGFLPVAYIPAMVFHEVERLDVIKMARLLVPLGTEALQLTAPVQALAGPVQRAFTRQSVLPAIAEAIHRLDLFSGFSDEQSARVARACRVAEFQAGQALFSAGEPAEALAILLEGSVDVSLGDPPRRVGSVEVGASVGEVSLLTGEVHSATVTARGGVSVALLTRDEVATLARQRPDIGVLLYRNMALGLGRKLRHLDVEVAEGT